MTFADLFDQYWWLIFPIFGMTMAVWGMQSSERRARSTMEVMKSYVDQGKEPPPEIMQLLKKGLDQDDDSAPSNRNSERAWSFIVFAAIAAGFGTAYWFTRTEDWSWTFLSACVMMALMAAGALGLLIFNRKS